MLEAHSMLGLGLMIHVEGGNAVRFFVFVFLVCFPLSSAVLVRFGALSGTIFVSELLALFVHGRLG